MIRQVLSTGFNPLLPNISIHILHNLFYTFCFGADKENLFNNQSFLVW